MLEVTQQGRSRSLTPWPQILTPNPHLSEAPGLRCLLTSSRLGQGSGWCDLHLLCLLGQEDLSYFSGAQSCTRERRPQLWDPEGAASHWQAVHLREDLSLSDPQFPCLVRPTGWSDALQVPRFRMLTSQEGQGTTPHKGEISGAQAMPLVLRGSGLLSANFGISSGFKS